jgi:hypothetical protein
MVVGSMILAVLSVKRLIALAKDLASPDKNSNGLAV